MFGYKVDIEQYCNYYRAPKESYGNWEGSNTNSFKSVYKADKYPDIVASLNIKEGTLCFVVWAEWSSGDSFGSSHNGNAEALAIFVDPESAKQFRDKVSKAKEDREYIMEFSTDDGQKHSVRCPWIGYFEDLTDIHIEQTILKYNLD